MDRSAILRLLNEGTIEAAMGGGRGRRGVVALRRAQRLAVELDGAATHLTATRSKRTAAKTAHSRARACGFCA